MTKDYANKQKAKLRVPPHEAYARAAPARQAHFAMPTWAGIGIGLLLGFLLAMVIYWQHQALTKRPEMTTIPITEKNTPAIPQKNSKPTPADANHSRFDFYTVLPAMTVELPPEEEADLPRSTTQDAMSNAQAAELMPTEPLAVPEKSAPLLRYFIQLGSFQQLTQAEELKAKLAFSGLEASIQTIKMNNRESRYRVCVGPFPSKEAARSSQQQIYQAYQLNGFIIKTHV